MTRYRVAPSPRSLYQRANKMSHAARRTNYHKLNIYRAGSGHAISTHPKGRSARIMSVYRGRVETIGVEPEHVNTLLEKLQDVHLADKHYSIQMCHRIDVLKTEAARHV